VLCEEVTITAAALNAGVSADAGNEDGTLLHHAAMTNERATVTELLLDKGALVDSRDTEDNTPLHRAVLANHVEVAKLLVEYGADVNASNVFGERPSQYRNALEGEMYHAMRVPARLKHRSGRGNER
jgi:uncharacterized protein